MFLLDTDHVGILQTQGNPEFTALSTRIGEHSGADFFVSIVSFHEQLLGWNAYIAKASDQSGVVKGYSRLERILTDFASANGVPFDDAASDVFIDLRRQRVRIGTMDLRIAAIAIANRMTVLTRNLVDFEKVPNLDVEDWTTSP